MPLPRLQWGLPDAVPLNGPARSSTERTRSPAPPSAPASSPWPTAVSCCATPKPRSAREMYTPAEMATIKARRTLENAEPGQSICDPHAGTGGLLRDSR
jgi:hypothetical protein